MGIKADAWNQGERLETQDGWGMGKAMSDAEWFDGDDEQLRQLFGKQLRAHVAYQDGAHSEAPALVFADADYEVGDGKVGLWEDGKQANEPAIVYVRADALKAANARIAELEEALSHLLTDVLDYERVNNLAPNPGRKYCWDSSERAARALDTDT